MAISECSELVSASRELEGSAAAEPDRCHRSSQSAIWPQNNVFKQWIYEWHFTEECSNMLSEKISFLIATKQGENIQF